MDSSKYRVELLPIVIRKDLKKIPHADNQRIMEKIKTLSIDPRPTWSKKLSAREEYQGRQGAYRILYVNDDSIKIVQVTKVRHRKDVYR